MKRGFLALAGLFALAASAEDRALLVGIDNYRHPRVGATPGSIADAQAMADLARRRFGFKPDAIRVLTDGQASANAIRRAVSDWLIAGTQPGDRVFFSYAGHGSQVADDNGDETDGYDETLAPYDVDPTTGSGMIRDDEFDGLIRELQGRRVVLVFDSCHSGTISRGLPRASRLPLGGGARYLPRHDQFRALFGTDATGGTRSLGGAGYVVSGGVDPRDLSVEAPFVESRDLRGQAGVVVVSAARSNQSALPLEVGGQFRGALSWVLGEVHDQGMPRVADLRAVLPERIRSLQSTGRLEGSQVPEIEVVGGVALEDRPLFGGWEAAPAVALANPASPFRVTVASREAKTVYYSGETFSFDVAVDAPGYLYLIAFSEGNVATVVFPNEQDLDNRVAPGRVTVPRGSYSFDVAPPFGRDVLVALFSTERLILGEKEQYTWAEVFARVLPGLENAVPGITVRGVRVSPKVTPADPRSWQAATLVLETRAGRP